jgi:hypothetical protein
MADLVKIMSARGTDIRNVGTVLKISIIKVLKALTSRVYTI